MKQLAILASVAALAVSGTANAAEQPRRIMSLSLCTDQLLLQLVSKDRITSVTYLSRSSEYSYLSAEAEAVPINYGNSEEVLRERPDLVLAGTFAAAPTRMLLKRIGVLLVEVPPAESFDQIRMNTRLVARAVGADEKGETLIADMDATLAELARTAPARRIVVAGWDGVGNVPAKGTLFDAILTAAGGENVVDRLGSNAFNGYTAIDLEQLVAVQPDILAFGNARVGQLDLSGERLKHRVVRKLFAGRQITYPETLYSCGLPQSVTVAARDLRRAMLEITAREAQRR
jgi:iron complex transport system substrate-binding protein